MEEKKKPGRPRKYDTSDDYYNAMLELRKEKRHSDKAKMERLEKDIEEYRTIISNVASILSDYTNDNNLLTVSNALYQHLDDKQFKPIKKKNK